MSQSESAFQSQLLRNLGRGPYYEPDENPHIDVQRLPVRTLAFYLPQFHPIPENDGWWGKGFTEWTNVTKALPRFEGHYQPHLPTDLGFYDLRLSDVVEEQAAMARRYGVSGFCFHHYWFGGRRLLETPLNNLLAAPEIDIDFCVSWANESWSRRWDGSNDDVLVQQTHSPEDDICFAEHLLPIFADNRYLRVHGRPLLIVYRPSVMPNAERTLERWRKYFLVNGHPEPYFAMVQGFGDQDPRKYGFDASVGFPPLQTKWVTIDKAVVRLDDQFEGFVGDYLSLAESQLNQKAPHWLTFPGVCPAWDNEARRVGRGITFVGSTPSAYGRWLEAACMSVLDRPERDERLVFINAWNEWAEGAHLEPDRHFGYAYLRQTARTLISLERTAQHSKPADRPSSPRAEKLK